MATKANQPHEFTPFLDNTRDHDRCRICSAHGHCPKCNTGAWGYGHIATDDRGMYYKCVEPERHQANKNLRREAQEDRERAELARLKAKYPDA